MCIPIPDSERVVFVVIILTRYSTSCSREKKQMFCILWNIRAAEPVHRVFIFSVKRITPQTQPLRPSSPILHYCTPRLVTPISDQNWKLALRSHESMWCGGGCYIAGWRWVRTLVSGNQVVRQSDAMMRGVYRATSAFLEHRVGAAV